MFISVDILCPFSKSKVTLFNKYSFICSYTCFIEKKVYKLRIIYKGLFILALWNSVFILFNNFCSEYINFPTTIKRISLL